MNDRESKMITLRTDESGKPTVWCDPEIADLVDALNTGDLSTVASCSGHGHRPGRISLKDGRELLVMNSEQADAAERLFGTDINGDFTNAGAQEAVAYGLPNTTIQIPLAEYEKLKADAERFLEAMKVIAGAKHTCSNCARRYDPDHYPCCSCNIEMEAFDHLRGKGEDLWKPMNYIKTAQEAIDAALAQNGKE